VPADDNLGPVPVVVTNNGVASDPVTVQLLPAAPELFAWKAKYAVVTADTSALPDLNNAPDTMPATAAGGSVVLKEWQLIFKCKFGEEIQESNLWQQQRADVQVSP